MWKSFKAMPMLLRFLTAVGLFVCLMVISTMRPNSVVHKDGRSISSAVWWASGAGPSMLVVAVLFGASTVMMLRRWRHARLAFLIAWISLNISVPYVAAVTGTGVASLWMQSVLGDALITVAIALYLYLGHGVRHYLHATGAELRKGIELPLLDR